MDIQSLLFQHPCNIYISGPSGCGKTEFVRKLIDYREDLFNIVPEKVVWCYKEWQPAYNLMKESFNFIKFIDGIPEDENEIVSDPSISHLIVFDDMLLGQGRRKNQVMVYKKRTSS